MALGYTTGLDNASLDAITTLIDAGVGAGHIKIYSGPRPASANDVATGILLYDFVMSDPAFPAASGGSMTANAIASVAAVGNGNALWFRMEDIDTNTVLDGDVTAVGLGGDIEMDFLVATIGQFAQVISFVISMP